MEISQDWHRALDSARRGDLQPARDARTAEPEGRLANYFYARCLAEAPRIDPDQYAEAIRLLLPLAEAQPTNPLFSQTLGLAFAREDSPDGRKEAAYLWKSAGLPHDLDLLGQAAFTIELQLRPFPEESPTDAIAWPEKLERPPDDIRDILSPDSASNDAVSPPEIDPPKLEPLGYLARRSLSRRIGQLESKLMAHQPLEALEGATALFNAGQESEELHFLAGVAAEEAGDPIRARAHLARSMVLAPTALIVRSALARVYWRLNLLDLAEVLWRSIPVEGPYDFGRHYHLALLHETCGDRAAALEAMDLALNSFFYDTRHYFLKRVFERWLLRHAEKPAAILPRA